VRNLNSLHIYGPFGSTYLNLSTDINICETVRESL